MGLAILVFWALWAASALPAGASLKLNAVQAASHSDTTSGVLATLTGNATRAASLPAPPSVLVIVFSRRSAFFQRSMVRELWLRAALTTNTKVRFGICHGRDEHKGRLQTEQVLHGDLAFLKCHEGYAEGALTDKAAAALEYFFSSTKRDVFMRVDDDTFVAWTRLYPLLAAEGTRMSYMGVPIGSREPCRNPSHLYYEPFETFNETHFPEAFAGGPGYILGRGVADAIIKGGFHRMHRLYNDDRAVGVWVDRVRQAGLNVTFKAIAGADRIWGWDSAWPLQDGHAWKDYPHMVHHGLSGETIACLSVVEVRRNPAHQLKSCFAYEKGRDFHIPKCWDPAPQASVWVHAYARSGSSTVLSMVSQAFREAAATEEQGQEAQGSSDGGSGTAPLPVLALTSRSSVAARRARLGLGRRAARASAHLAMEASPMMQLGHVFSLFEPCHEGDDLEPELAAKGCGALIGELANCRFDKIKALNGWGDSHSMTRGAGEYSPDAASAACRGADVVAFKTISQAGELFHVQEHGLPVLQLNPRLRMVDIVRDPRDIFASWMSTFPFNDTSLGGVARDPSVLTGLCDSFASNLGITHDRVHRVVFESLVKDPEGVMKKVFDFLRAPYGEVQKAWVRETFNAKECPGVDVYIAPYSDCHTNATGSLEKWRNVLRPDETAAFASHPACVEVAHAFHYALV